MRELLQKYDEAHDLQQLEMNGNDAFLPFARVSANALFVESSVKVVQCP